MNPRTFLRTFVDVENAAADMGASCLEARAAVATLLMAQEYGWPSAQETLSDRQWWRVLDILERAGISIPRDFTGPSAEPESVDASFLGPYARRGMALSLLTLPGCAFIVRQYIGPLLTPRTVGKVKGVEFDGSRWQVTLSMRGRADQRVPLGMFVSCTQPLAEPSTDGARGVATSTPERASAVGGSQASLAE